MSAWTGSACRSVYLGVLIPLFLIGLSSSIYAIPTNCTFEGYESGVRIQDVDGGWTVGDVDAATVVKTNYVYAGGYPEIHQNGASNVLKLAGHATNTVTGGVGSEVWVDTMIAMVAWSGDPDPLPNVPSDVQAACIVNTNGNLMVRHYEPAYGEPYWTEIPETASYGLTSGWARLTFHFDYTQTYGDYGAYFFQVFCDGQLITNVAAYVSRTDPEPGWDPDSSTAGVIPGGWFIVNNFSSQTNGLNSIAVSDAGYLDDLQVTTVNPLTTAKWLIAASAGTGVTIAPSGQTFVTNGGDIAFTITTNNPNYEVTNVVVDGNTFLGVVSGHTFTDVTANHTIEVLTGPSVVTSWKITASAGTGAGINPVGDVYVVDGNNQIFTISTNNPNYAITNVIVDGAAQGVLNTYTFTGVTEEHTIQVLTGIRKTANGTPYSWLVQFDLDESHDDVDIEPDGHKTWQEYVMGTHPSNAVSVCMVRVDLYGSSNLVSWYATTNSGVTNVFYVDRATNLMTSWDRVGDDIPRASDGTNKWWDTSLPATNTIYYRPGTVWVR